MHETAQPRRAQHPPTIRGSQLQGITATTRDEHTQNQLQHEFSSLLPLQIVAFAWEKALARAAEDGGGWDALPWFTSSVQPIAHCSGAETQLPPAHT